MWFCGWGTVLYLDDKWRDCTFSSVDPHLRRNRGCRFLPHLSAVPGGPRVPRLAAAGAERCHVSARRELQSTYTFSSLHTHTRPHTRRSPRAPLVVVAQMAASSSSSSPAAASAPFAAPGPHRRPGLALRPSPPTPPSSSLSCCRASPAAAAVSSVSATAAPNRGPRVRAVSAWPSRLSDRVHWARSRLFPSGANRLVVWQGMGLRCRASEGAAAAARKEAPLKVMISGAPASGKGTQCRMIVEKV